MLNSSSNYDKYLSKKRQLTSFEKEGIYLSKSSKNITVFYLFYFVLSLKSWILTKILIESYYQLLSITFIFI